MSQEETSQGEMSREETPRRLNEGKILRKKIKSNIEDKFYYDKFVMKIPVYNKRNWGSDSIDRVGIYIISLDHYFFLSRKKEVLSK